jgi:hypothetical protein
MPRMPFAIPEHLQGRDAGSTAPLTHGDPVPIQAPAAASPRQTARWIHPAQSPRAHDDRPRREPRGSLARRAGGCARRVHPERASLPPRAREVHEARTGPDAGRPRARVAHQADRAGTRGHAAADAGLRPARGPARLRGHAGLGALRRARRGDAGAPAARPPSDAPRGRRHRERHAPRDPLRPRARRPPIVRAARRRARRPLSRGRRPAHPVVSLHGAKRARRPAPLRDDPLPRRSGGTSPPPRSTPSCSTRSRTPTRATSTASSCLTTSRPTTSSTVPSGSLHPRRGLA